MNTKFDLVAMTFDGNALHGLYSKLSSSCGTVVHLHGTWGNFYANPFIIPLADMYCDMGYDFLTINIVGHDETSIDEDFEKSIKSIEFWINELNLKLPLILQGHSLGALKVLRLIKNKSSVIKNTAAIVLLSPFDIVSFYLGDQNNNGSEKLEKLTRMIAEGKENDNVPSDIFALWPISVKTYFEAVKEQGYLDVFNSRNGVFDAQLFSEFKNKMLVVLGSKDYASTPETEKMKQQIDANFLDNTTTVLIKDAPHNFAGCIDKLVNEVKMWLG